MLATDEGLRERPDVRPLARVVAYEVVGCDPTEMGIGPVIATRALLQRVGLTIAQLDMFEVIEVC